MHTKEELMLLQNLVTKILNTFQLVSLVGNDLVRKSLKNNNPINIFSQKGVLLNALFLDSIHLISQRKYSV